MYKPETLQEFYKRTELVTSDDLNQGLGHFNVFRRENIVESHKCCISYNRRDFFKITLVIGQGELNFAGKGIKIENNALIFSHPNIPYSWEATSKKQTGYFCLFTNSFLHSLGQSQSLKSSPLCRIDTERVFVLNDDEIDQVSFIYEQMLKELNSNYEFKYDFIRNHVNLLIHTALKTKAVKNYYKHPDASSRITAMFLELLERQFPVSVENTLKFKTATDFAFPLAVHVNHLNRAVKKVTNKTTTNHISARILDEAIALLKNTDWSISDISYCLGFETPAYFSIFFKKHTNKVPSSYRIVV